jgi:hypothetical protein
MEQEPPAPATGTKLQPAVRLVMIPILASSLVVAVAGLWLSSPRFSITGPSLIDNWYEIRWSGFAFHQLTSLSYDPTSFDAQRFRPAIWVVAWIRWHVLGGPTAMTGPNVWNLVRIWLFGTGLCTAVVAGVRPRVRQRLGCTWLTVIAALPALAVLATPGLTQTFLALMPQEPLLVGAAAIGLVLLLLALRLSTALPGRKRALAVPVVIVVGSVVWAFGVYQKEASITILCLAPFLWADLRGRWSGTGRMGRAALACVLAILVVPLIHVLLAVHGLANHKAVIYGASVPASIGGWISRLHAAATQQWGVLAQIDGGPAWQGLGQALPLLLAWQWLRERRPPWLALGLGALAMAVLVFQGLPLTIAPRYLVPVCALMAVALALIAAEAPSWGRAIIAVAVALFVLNNLNAAHNYARTYVAQENAATRLVSAVSALAPRRCPVYLVHADIERNASIPELVSLRRPPVTGCVPSYQAVTVDMYNNPYLRIPSLGVSDNSLLDACLPPGWKQIGRTDLAVIDGCRRLRRQVRRSNGSVVPVSRVLATDRINVPASPYAMGMR